MCENKNIKAIKRQKISFIHNFNLNIFYYILNTTSLFKVNTILKFKS